MIDQSLIDLIKERDALQEALEQKKRQHGPVLEDLSVFFNQLVEYAEFCQTHKITNSTTHEFEGELFVIEYSPVGIIISTNDKQELLYFDITPLQVAHSILGNILTLDTICTNKNTLKSEVKWVHKRIKIILDCIEYDISEYLKFQISYMQSLLEESENDNLLP